MSSLQHGGLALGCLLTVTKSKERNTGGKILVIASLAQASLG